MILLRWVTRSELDARSTGSDLVLSVIDLPKAAATAMERSIQVPKRTQREDKSSK